MTAVQVGDVFTVSLWVTEEVKRLEGLLRKMGTGLLVTKLIGFGINQITGDYSRGAAGFWVENGVIQYPVEEITIASRLQDIFAGITAVGADLPVHCDIGCPSIMVGKMTVAGK